MASKTDDTPQATTPSESGDTTKKTSDAAKTDETPQETADRTIEERHPEGEPPVVGAEGGIIEEGTGDWAVDSDEIKDDEGTVKDGTIVVADLNGNKFRVPVGIDGKTAVSTQNPVPKAVLK